ncbi:MAG: hypothetical protein EDM82_04950 [Cyanobacteria bacterium CYA]|nr:MAG: hypothetical protein EDM82_04950 [Cyanobacteria bacterium CYA]
MGSPVSTNGLLARSVQMDERSPVIESQVTFITPELYTPAEEVKGNVVGQIPSPMAMRSAAERARLGAGPEAPEWIIIRFRDGLFAIDPFLQLPDVTPETARQLFKPMKYGTGAPVATLGTDRSLFNRQRIEATEDLFMALEHERIEWLKQHRYVQAVRSWSGDPDQASPQSRSNERKDLPEDMPRTRPIEEVRASSARVMLVQGDQPVRVSLPDLGVPGEVRQRVAANGGYLKRPGEVKKQAAAGDKTVAQAERKPEEPAKQ